MQYPGPGQPASKITVSGETPLPLSLAAGLRGASGALPSPRLDFSPRSGPPAQRHTARRRVPLTVGPDSQEVGSRASLVQVLTLHSLGYFTDLVWPNLELVVGHVSFLVLP